MRECPCGREVRGGHLCRSCLGALVAELRDVPSIVDDLDIMLARRDHMGDPMRSAATVADVTPNLVASLAADRLTQQLAAWACTLGRASIRGVHPPVHPRGLSLWLSVRREEIRQHPLAGQLRDEVTEVIRDARRTVDCPPTAYLGPCDACGRTVYGYGGEDASRCRGCGSAYDTAARRAALLEQSITVWRSARELSRALPGIVGRPVSVSLINALIRHGLVSTRIARSGHREVQVSSLLRYLYVQAPPPLGTCASLGWSSTPDR